MKKVGFTMNNNNMLRVMNIKQNQNQKINALPPIFSLPSTTNMNLNPAFNVNNNMKNSINNLIPHLPRMTKTIPNTPYMSNGGPTPFETFLAEASYLNNYNNMNNFYNMNRIASATVYKKKRKRK